MSNLEIQFLVSGDAFDSGQLATADFYYSLSIGNLQFCLFDESIDL